METIQLKIDVRKMFVEFQYVPFSWETAEELESNW